MHLRSLAARIRNPARESEATIGHGRSRDRSFRLHVRRLTMRRRSRRRQPFALFQMKSAEMFTRDTPSTRRRKMTGSNTTVTRTLNTPNGRQITIYYSGRPFILPMAGNQSRRRHCVVSRTTRREAAMGEGRSPAGGSRTTTPSLSPARRSGIARHSRSREPRVGSGSTSGGGRDGRAG